MATEKKNVTDTISTFKGFSTNWTCHNGFQFEIGKTYEHNGKVKACESGFHACEDPLDVLGYYPPGVSRYATVKQSGDLCRHDDDSKIASRSITVEAELSLKSLIEAGMKFRFERVDWTKAAQVTGEREGAVVKDNSGAASATGDRGAASATGDSGAASATGDRGAASATGYRGAASATGDRGAASATGYRGAASATGYRGAASATGDSGAASATGYRGAAMASGRFGKAQAAEGNAIFLVYRDAEWKIVHAWAGIAGRDGIKADVFYTLDENGKPVEASP